MYTLINLFAMLFVTMGPIKVLIVFAEKTRQVEGAVRRRVAYRAVGVATVIGLLFILFGWFLMDLFKFSIGALTVAGGLILLVFALQMVLAEVAHEPHVYGEREVERMAIYPLAMPLMASPMGIAVLTMVSASKNVTDEALLGLIIPLVAVMGVNLLALLLEDQIMDRIAPEFLQVAHRILGILLAALAVQSIHSGLVQLGALEVALGALV